MWGRFPVGRSWRWKCGIASRSWGRWGRLGWRNGGGRGRVGKVGGEGGGGGTVVVGRDGRAVGGGEAMQVWEERFREVVGEWRPVEGVGEMAAGRPYQAWGGVPGWDEVKRALELMAARG